MNGAPRGTGHEPAVHMPPAPASHWPTAVFVFAPLVVALFVPLLGALASVSTLLIGPTAGRSVWRRRSRASMALAAVGAFAVFWMGPILSVSGAISPLRSEWLLIPLCAPDATGWLVPAAIASIAYAAGCILSVRTGRPLLWPVAAAVAIVAYELTGRVVDAVGSRWVC